MNRYQKFFDEVIPDLDPRLHDFGDRKIPSNDNWCPTFDDGTVEGSVHVLSSNELRICFWGNDDTGMELDLPLSLEEYQRWNKWISNLSFVSMDMLLNLGFWWA